MTGGLFAALGRARSSISGKTQTGWIALATKFPGIKQLVADAAAVIKAAPAVAAAAAANVLLEIYRQGLLWKFVGSLRQAKFAGLVKHVTPVAAVKLSNNSCTDYFVTYPPISFVHELFYINQHK